MEISPWIKLNRWYLKENSGVPYGGPNMKCKELYLLWYNAMYSVESQPTFQRNVSPPSSGSKNKASKKPAGSKFLPATFQILSKIFVYQWSYHSMPPFPREVRATHWQIIKSLKYYHTCKGNCLKISFFTTWNVLWRQHVFRDLRFSW
jgi:hypothetical protein